MTDKKPHWSQTPEGRAKMSRIMKARHRKLKHAQETRRDPRPPKEDIPSDVFAYALGRIEAWIEAYAQSAGVPPGPLASKLGQVLHRKSGR